MTTMLEVWVPCTRCDGHGARWTPNHVAATVCTDCSSLGYSHATYYPGYIRRLIPLAEALASLKAEAE